MGNEQSASVRIANETEIPLVFVISQVGPLYWGVINPGERVTRITGRVWFTVKCYPYDGHNEPTTADAVWGVVIPTAAALAIVVTAGTAAAATAPVAGSYAAVLAPIAGETLAAAEAGAAAAYAAGKLASTIVPVAHSMLIKDASRCLNCVTKHGHYANGDWIHVRGGIKKNVLSSTWQPMRFEK
ncbi:hypothetical protein PHYPSEUDO_010799 [Phytophthora pseudosyringae]|uniref:Uncharacterized protein n=1 Tax=Phytophthora pseudosyringae TaxID=221518 RepID=A0A8T1W7H7_9STRA|nr:hypothetical protein PHYPSEUDO_010799 [Phytophthora pseudosyringae]